MFAFVARKRFPGEEWDVRQFIQPMTPGVRRIASRLPDVDFIQAAWEWVVRNIRYPYGPQDTEDRHTLEAFLKPDGSPKYRVTTDDFWSFPAETLAFGEGDCEDATFLLVSLLRTKLPPENVFATIGLFQDFGHAWVTVMDGSTPLVLETTPRRQDKMWFQRTAEGPPYYPFFRFNDQQVIIVRKFHIPFIKSYRKVALIEAFRLGNVAVKTSKW